MFTTSAYACDDGSAPLSFATIKRRDPGPRDIEIEIEFCGVCHSDIHTARSEWPGTLYPCVPGHEIVGKVGRVGSAVTAFKTGQRVGVGCIVDSCHDCQSCADGLEQFCEKGMTGTYNSPDRATGGGAHTLGGYSSHVVVDERYVLRIPDGIDPAAAAPLLCAGITTYSPLRHWKAGPGKKVGVVGLGGLGHMGVKLANAMGATVVMITTSPSKAEDARRLGAHEVIVSRDEKQMAAAAGTLDIIIDAVAADHDINAYLALLKRDGALIQVGAPEKPLSVNVFSLIIGRKTFAGSLIGGIQETQEMLDFCAAHGIAADIEMIRIDQINEAYERMLKSDVRYRFVIDMKSLPRQVAA
jgi:uncharacterized zinc-type alcohol dehydrogenase-like protein